MKNVIGLIAIVALAGSMAYGDSVRTWNGDDGAPVFRVKNSGTETVTITVNSQTNVVVTNGTAANADIALAPGYTVASLTAAIEATTNSAGVRTLSVDGMCSLAADTVSNMVISGTTTINANDHKWQNGPKWDSSADTNFNTYYPKFESGGVGDPKTLSHVFGDVSGTGNITLTFYIDRTEVLQKRIVSPVYVWDQITTSTNTNTTDDVSPGVFDIELDIPVARDESLLIRANRATTATDNGGLGMVLDLKD